MAKFIKYQGQVYERVDANTTDFIDGLTLACEKARKLINNDFRKEVTQKTEAKVSSINLSPKKFTFFSGKVVTYSMSFRFADDSIKPIVAKYNIDLGAFCGHKFELKASCVLEERNKQAQVLFRIFG